MTKEINLTINLGVSDTLYCSFMTSVSLASGLLIILRTKLKWTIFRWSLSTYMYKYGHINKNWTKKELDKSLLELLLSYLLFVPTDKQVKRFKIHNLCHHYCFFKLSFTNATIGIFCTYESPDIIWNLFIMNFKKKENLKQRTNSHKIILRSTISKLLPLPCIQRNTPP